MDSVLIICERTFLLEFFLLYLLNYFCIKRQLKCNMKLQSIPHLTYQVHNP